MYLTMWKKKSKKKGERKEYSIGIANVIDGVSHINVIGSGKYYSTRGKNEPEIYEIGKYKDKYKPLGRILKKLGLWENGKVLQQVRRVE